MTANSLYQTAGTRVREHPHVQRKYGASIMLKKAFPDMATVAPSAQPSLNVTGAELTSVSLGKMSDHVRSMLQEQASRDTAIAAHLLHAENVSVLSVPKGAMVSLTAEQIYTAGAWTTLLIVAHKESHVEIEEDVSVISGTGYGSTLVILDIRDGASVSWTGAIQRSDDPHMITRMARIARNGLFEYTGLLTGCSLLREHIVSDLVGEGARVVARRACVGKRDEQYDLTMRAVHAAPNTESDLQARCVLGGKSQAVCHGLIRVQPGMAGADGNQWMNTLMVSDRAEADAVPSLEIETDDVRCSHGVTVSRVQDDDMFYMRSRGLSRRDATDLIINGFIQNMIQYYPEARRTKISQVISDTVTEMEVV